MDWFHKFIAPPIIAFISKITCSNIIKMLINIYGPTFASISLISDDTIHWGQENM